MQNFVGAGSVKPLKVARRAPASIFINGSYPGRLLATADISLLILRLLNTPFVVVASGLASVVRWLVVF